MWNVLRLHSEWGQRHPLSTRLSHSTLPTKRPQGQGSFHPCVKYCDHASSLVSFSLTRFYLCQRMLSLVGISLGRPNTPGNVRADPCTVPLTGQAYFSLLEAWQEMEASKLASCSKAPCYTSTATMAVCPDFDHSDTKRAEEEKEKKGSLEMSLLTSSTGQNDPPRGRTWNLLIT